ncbi:MAG: SAM-dependent chlorinase/fluorinase [Elusimicrobia bacterium]|nr:SAM-dependent chlorinase/fluorinase [Elusimicrobiota bacterium]
MNGPKTPSLAALLTDFGAASVYPAVMKGVMLGLCPSARIVDFSHGVPPGDIAAGAFTLMQGAPYYPEGTLFVCVVDPGVGTDRRLLWAASGGRQFLAPDNGLLSWLDEGQAVFEEMRSVENGELFLQPVSGTFHGRDIFAPAAARLLNGFAPEQLGPRVQDMKRLPFPRPHDSNGKLEGAVLFVDSFGNCITNVKASQAGNREGFFGGVRLGASRKTYGLAEKGQAAVVEGSAGFLELAVNGWSFAEKFRAEAGDKVVFK